MALKNIFTLCSYRIGAKKKKDPAHRLIVGYCLVAILYRDRPDAALCFWEPQDHKLFLFVKWVSDCKTPGMIRRYLEMLSSLATGEGLRRWVITANS